MNNGTANVNTKCFPFIAILAQETCAAAWPYQAYISVKLERIAGRSASPTARVLHSATVSIAHSKKKKNRNWKGWNKLLCFVSSTVLYGTVLNGIAAFTWRH
jgi:hypothetical protein